MRGVVDAEEDKWLWKVRENNTLMRRETMRTGGLAALSYQPSLSNLH